jgi:hypothetical protein
MSIADELQKLQELHRSGALNDQEFAQAKAVVLAGSLSAPPERTPNRARIRAALALVLRAEMDRAWVIFSERQSEKFVQFIRTDTNQEAGPQDLLLDLPFQTLNRDEEPRAEAFFREAGVRAKEAEVCAPRWAVWAVRRPWLVYRMPFGRDLDAAADAAVQVFARVYQFPADFELAIAGPDGEMTWESWPNHPPEQTSHAIKAARRSTPPPA